MLNFSWKIMSCCTKIPGQVFLYINCDYAVVCSFFVVAFIWCGGFVFGSCFVLWYLVAFLV